MSYQTTPNKDVIRRTWDRAVIHNWRVQHGHALTYFGLPGPELLDFRDWQPELAAVRTGVEMIGRTKSDRDHSNRVVDRMLVNAIDLGMDGEFQVLRGEVEKILISGEDAFGELPRLSDGAPDHSWRYDVFNLDFEGGIAYTSQNGLQRVDGLKDLFRHQRGHSFVLLMTITVRDDLGGILDDHLSEFANQAGVDPTPFEWARSQARRDQKLRMVVPFLLYHAAPVHNFKARIHPAITYEGHGKARLVHFAAEFETTGGLLGISPQSPDELSRLPLVEASGGALRLAPDQAPGSSPEAAERSLRFLDEAARVAIVGASDGIGDDR